MSDVKIGLKQLFPDLTTTTDLKIDFEDTNFGGASPKLSLWGMNKATALNTRVNNFQNCFGAAQSSTTTEQWLTWVNNSHAEATSIGRRHQMETQIGWIANDPAASRDGWFNFHAFGTDKATINVGNTFNANYGIWALLLGGADVSIDVGEIVPNNELADVALGAVTTGIDMTNAVLILSTCETAWSVGTSATGTGKQSIGFGAYDGTTFTQAGLQWTQPSGQANSNPGMVIASDRVATTKAHNTATKGWELEWTGATSTTFTLTNRNAQIGTDPIGYVAIALPSDWNAHVSVQDTPTGTPPVDQSYSPVSGWTPKLLLQLITLMQSVGSQHNTSQAGGFGTRVAIGTGSDDEYCTSSNDEADAADVNSECGIHDKGFLNDHDGTAGLDMSLKSFDSGGWTSTFADTMGTATKTINLIMGEDDAAPSGHNPQFLPLQGVA